MKFKVFQDTSETDNPFQFYFTEIECATEMRGSWYSVIDDYLYISPDHETHYIGEYTTP